MSRSKNQSKKNNMNQRISQQKANEKAVEEKTDQTATSVETDKPDTAKDTDTAKPKPIPDNATTKTANDNSDDKEKGDKEKTAAKSSNETNGKTQSAINQSNSTDNKTPQKSADNTKADTKPSKTEPSTVEKDNTSTASKASQKTPTTTDKEKDTPANKQEKETMSKPNTSQTKKKSSNNRQNEKNTQPKQNDMAKSADAAKNTTAGEPATGAHTTPVATPHVGTEKKGSNKVAGLALLLGVVGTGIAAYDFNEIRALKSAGDATATLTTQVNALDSKIATLGNKEAEAALAAQLETLVSQQKALKAAEERVNQRVDALEQMQNGLSKSVQSDIDNALKSRMSSVEALLAKVKDIELGQKGLSKNLSEVTAVGQAISSEGMTTQEVGYLLRMASYKLQSEGDVLGAKGLLTMAGDKLLAANKGKTDDMIDAIRAKIIQLDGVQPVDTNKLLGQLKEVSRSIAYLVVKTEDKTATAATDTTEKTADTEAAQSSGFFGKIGDVIASGVKYTPNDPSKIDISAETILIEKRLMQADVRTAELAVQSRNETMLSESVRAINSSLDSYFADDKTAQSIKALLLQIESSKLKTSLPDVSELVKNYEKSQNQ